MSRSYPAVWLFRLIPPKIVFWASIFCIGAIFFAIFRLLFLLMHFDLWQLGEYADVFKAFWIGFRFDSVILSIIILPLLLVSLLPFIDFRKQLFRRIITIILTLVFAFIFLLCLVDLRFFDHFGSHLNYWAMEYIEYPTMLLYGVANYGSFWLLMALWTTISILFYWWLKKIQGIFSNIYSRVPVITKVLTYILAVLILAFGIRGRLGIKPLDWGTAFFSENQFLNQLPLNCIFTLSHSIYEEARDGRGLFDQSIERFKFYDHQEAYQTLSEMLGNNQTSPVGKFNLTRQYYPRDSLEFLPNVVIIILESWSADKIGVLGCKKDVTPEFDRLSQDGLLFDNFYANGIRTNRGIPAILCSFASPPGRSIMRRYAANYPFRSIADILGELNYRSIFAYGGDIEFDNMRGFLKSVGYNDFISEEDFSSDEMLGKWGVPDHILFDRLITEIEVLPRPFNLTLLSLSYHEPYLVPDDRFNIFDDSIPEAQKLNCFYYSDWAVGKFMSDFRQLPAFDSTIFIFTADHCPHQSAKYPIDPNQFRIPLLLYAPGIIKTGAGLISKTGSQMDILPTLLGIMRISTEHSSWGRDLLSLDDDDPGFAILVQNYKLGLIEGPDFYLHWINGTNMLFNINDKPYLQNNLLDSISDAAAPMKKRLLSFIQMADYLSHGDKKSDSE